MQLRREGEYEQGYNLRDRLARNLAAMTEQFVHSEVESHSR
jgi:hypothetical protein